ncbi:MAG: hypothetical protein ACUVWP_09000 [bacterium]
MRFLIILINLFSICIVISAENIAVGFKTGTDFGVCNIKNRAIFVWAREDGSLGLCSVKISATSISKIYSTGVNQYTNMYPSISISGNNTIIVYPDEEGKLRFLFYDILADGSLRYTGKYVASERVRVGLSSIVSDDLLFVSMMGDSLEPFILCYEVGEDSVKLITQHNIVGEKCLTIPKLCVFENYLYITWIDAEGDVHLRALEIKTQGGVNLIDRGERSLLIKTVVSNVKNVAHSDVVMDGGVLYLSWVDSKDRYLHIRSYTPSGGSVGNYTAEITLRERLSKYKILIVNDDLWVFWVGDGGNMPKIFSPSWSIYGKKM